MSPETLFDRALERYERPLVSYARTITGDLESARDAVQETFLRLSRQDLAALQPRLAPWLFFVCRNCALDHVRKIIRFSDTPLDEELADAAPSPSEQASNAEDATQLHALIARLPAQQQELVKLKFEGGLSYREMADTLRISVSLVGVQLHHALQTLRQHWHRADSAPLQP